MDYHAMLFAGCTLLVILAGLAYRYFSGPRPPGRATISLKWHCLKVNKPLCEALGYDAKEFLRMDLQRIIHPEDLHKDIPYIQQVISGQQEQYTTQQRYLDKSGNLRAMRAAFSLVRDKKNVPHYFVIQLEPLLV
jgi:PAS domain S-box-containing protein